MLYMFEEIYIRTRHTPTSRHYLSRHWSYGITVQQLPTTSVLRLDFVMLYVRGDIPHCPAFHVCSWDSIALPREYSRHLFATLVDVPVFEHRNGAQHRYVQLTALYPAYIFAARPGARAQFGRALDLIWADTSANTFAARGALSGPHSRDYDTLLGHGMLLLEM